MALINMKCSSCGAILTPCDGYAVCDYCGSVYFRLVSDVPADNAEVMSLSEFTDAIEKNTDTYSVNCSAGTISDADGELIKSKLKAAEKALDDGKPYLVKDYLKGVPDCFPAARLRLLASVDVKSEASLCLFAGDLNRFPEYGELLAVADEETRNVYVKIREKCLSNARTVSEIAKGHEFLRVGQYEDGLKYAKQTVARYPFFSRAWELLIKARCLCDEKYDPTEDLKRFEACPDAAVTVSGGEKDYYGSPAGIDPVIAGRVRRIVGKRRSAGEFFSKYLLKPLLVLIGIGALIGIWQLIDLLFS